MEVNQQKPFEVRLPKNRSANIKVIGVGGGGSNAVNHMYKLGITGVDYVVCNTDAQALESSPINNKIQLGDTLTEGLGAGANPETGKKAAEESLEKLKEILDTNTKMVFITAGMGGGTGTGAAPVIAKMAKEKGLLVVGIVTIPFNFEGKKRMKQADKGIQEIRKYVDSLIIICNDKIRELHGNLGHKDAFVKADEILATAAKGIAEVITQRYAVNIDLNDAKKVLQNSGTALMGSAISSGENKAEKAIEAALHSPLLNDNDITGAKNVLLLIVSGKTQATLDEIGYINEYIQHKSQTDTNIILGLGDDESLGDGISVTVVATGFSPAKIESISIDVRKVVHPLNEEQKIDKKLSVQNSLNNGNSKLSDLKEAGPLFSQPNENTSSKPILNSKIEEETDSNKNIYTLDNEFDPLDNKHSLQKEDLTKTTALPKIKECFEEKSEAEILKEIKEDLHNTEEIQKIKKEELKRPYEKDNIEVESNQEQKTSRFTLDFNDKDELKIRENNSYLDDNVD